MTQNGYVVEHLNNDPKDCRICNLAFMKRNQNNAKGQYFDKESEGLRHSIAVSIFNDFSTGNYQITIGCNASIIQKKTDGTECYVNAIKLLYKTSYSEVVLDAERILTQYDEKDSFDLMSLNFVDYEIIEALRFNLTEEEKRQTIIERDGKKYILIGNNQTYIHSIYFKEGWDVLE